MKKIKYKKIKKTQPNVYEYTGIYKDNPTEMQLFIYDDDDFKEYTQINVSDISSKINNDKVKWLNVHGLNDIKIIEAIGNLFKVDHYIIGDILNTSRRIQMEELDNMLFFSIKSILPDEILVDSIKVEEISFLLTQNTLISFQERRAYFFNHVRSYIRTHTGIVRKKGSDYLLFLMLEAVMENFFITIENYEEKTEQFILLAKKDSNIEILGRIEIMRDNFSFLKRSIIPLRDALFSIKNLPEDDDFRDIISPKNVMFFERLYQKSLDLLEQIDYDMSSLDGALNFFFLRQGYKTNEVMKILTIVASIFIPLTFIVGVYGMNFDNMPELHYKNSYYVVLTIMFFL